MAVDDAVRFALEAERIRDLASHLEWTEGWYGSPHGYPRDVFRYWLCLLGTNPISKTTEIVMRLWFFENLTWYVAFEAPAEIAEELIAPA